MRKFEEKVEKYQLKKVFNSKEGQQRRGLSKKVRTNRKQW